MFKSKKFFGLGLALLSLSAMAGVAKTYFSTKAESHFDYVKTSDDYNVYRLSNQKYFIQELFTPTQKKRYLFSALENSQIFEDMDHVENSLQLSAYTEGNGKAFGQKVYSLNEPATSAGTAYNDQNLLVLSYNTDAAETSYRAYDLATGQLIISYQDLANQKVSYPAPYIVSVPNSSVPSRYVGLLTSNAAHDFDEPATPPAASFQNAVLVKYGSRNALTNKWMIQVQAQTDFMASVTKSEVIAFNNAPNSHLEVGENLINLWDLDGATDATGIGGFAFRLTIALGDSDIVVILPVKNDKLDLSQAQLPARAKISVIK